MDDKKEIKKDVDDLSETVFEFKSKELEEIKKEKEVSDKE